MVNETCFLLRFIHRWIWFVSAAAEFCLDRNQSFFQCRRTGKQIAKSWWLEKTKYQLLVTNRQEEIAKFKPITRSNKDIPNPYQWLGATRKRAKGTLCHGPSTGLRRVSSATHAPTSTVF